MGFGRKKIDFVVYYVYPNRGCTVRIGYKRKEYRKTEDELRR